MTSACDQVLRIAARGDGVTQAGQHVAGAVPGDWLDESGRLHRGPHWQPPACRHFGQCGGCQLQHADDVALAQFVRDRVANALAAQQVAAATLRPSYLSPPASRRRTALKVQRTGASVRIGYAERGSNRLVAISQCPVLHPRLTALLAPLCQLMGRLLGPREAAKVQLTLIDQGVDVLIAGPEAQGLCAHDAMIDFCESHAIARLAVDDGNGAEDRWCPEPVSVTIGGAAVPLPHAPFLQATADGEAELVRCVREAVGGALHIADLFCGIGTFALSLPANARIHAAEAGRDAALALRAAANSAQRAITVEHRDLYRRPFTVDELDRLDAVILDPPRAGAAEQAAQLARSAVPTIAYVSCNPTSFARDATMLIAGGYRLQWVRPVGQFRWSTHVELVACLVR